MSRRVLDLFFPLLSPPIPQECAPGVIRIVYNRFSIEYKRRELATDSARRYCPLYPFASQSIAYATASTGIMNTAKDTSDGTTVQSPLFRSRSRENSRRVVAIQRRSTKKHRARTVFQTSRKLGYRRGDFIITDREKLMDQ